MYLVVETVDYGVSRGYPFIFHRIENLRFGEAACSLFTLQPTWHGQ